MNPFPYLYVPSKVIQPFETLLGGMAVKLVIDGNGLSQLLSWNPFGIPPFLFRSFADQ
jgi:hypothetical protein